MKIQRHIPLTLFLIGILTTFTVTYLTYKSITREQQLRFNATVQTTSSRIVRHIDTYLILLRGASGLFAANGSIDRYQFHAFAQHVGLLSNYPGLQALGYTLHVSDSEKKSVTEFMHQQGVLDFQFTPQTSKADHFATIYIEPETTGNKKVIGFDLSTETVRREAMEKARDTGEAIASGKVQLLNNTDPLKQFGFLLFVPVYHGDPLTYTTAQQRQSALQGFVYGPFRIYDMFTQIISDDHPPGIEFIVYDGTEINQDSLIYSSYPTNRRIPPNPHYAEAITLPVAGRNWTIYFFSTNEFPGSIPTFFIPFIVISGICLSIFVYYLSLTQLLARRRAEIAVQKFQTSEQKLRSSETRLRRLIEEKDDFISIASHELKTPLTSIKAFAQIMERRFKESNDTLSRTYIHRMSLQIKRLSDLVMDLLDVTKIQSGKIALRMEQFDINTLIDEVITDVSPTTSKHTIIHPTTERIIVTADAGRIDQVLTNFLSNAIKYSPVGQKIIVTARTHHHNVIVGVQDFGVGIPEDEKKNIFDRFYQVKKNRIRHDPSLGLGLYISSEIITRHKGKIWVESQEGSGSIFYFSLPLG